MPLILSGIGRQPPVKPSDAFPQKPAAERLAAHRVQVQTARLGREEVGHSTHSFGKHAASVFSSDAGKPGTAVLVPQTRQLVEN